MSHQRKYFNGVVPEELKGKFRQARGHIRKISFIKGLALLIGCLLVSFIIAVVLDRILRLEPLYRMIVLITILAGAFFVLVWSLALPVLRRYNARSIAVSVEAANPKLGDSLLTAVELTEEAESGNTKTSLELAKAHTQKTSEYASNIDFNSIIPFRTVTKTMIFAIVSFAVIAGFYIARTPVVMNVLERLLHPYSGPEVFTYTNIKIEPGDSYIKKGDDIQVSAILDGVIPGNGDLFWKTENNQWEKIRLAQADARISHKFSSVLAPISYKFNAGDARSDIYTIKPIVPPSIKTITPTIIYPEYTRLSPKVLRNSGGSISVIKGSKVVITALLNKPCTEASITWMDGNKYPMTISDSVITSEELNITENGTYSISLVDELGFTNGNPTYYRIEALKDVSPTIVIERPPQYTEAIPDAIALITYSIIDDFGIEKIWIDYTVNKRPESEEADILPEHIIQGTANVRVEDTEATSIHSDYNFLLSELALKSGDVVSFRLKAQDMDNLTGPNIGESEEIKIKIITHEESLEKILSSQEDIQRRIKFLIKKQTENEDAVELLAKTSKEQNDFSKSDKENLAFVRKTQEEITESDKDIAADVEKVIGNMQTNPLIDLRSMIQMNDVKKALENLAESEMTDASNQMKNAEKASNSASRSQSLDNTGNLQDQIIQKLEEIDKQLSKIKDEQMVASLAKMGRKLAKEQDENIQDTDEARAELSGMMPEDLGNPEKRKLKKLVDKEKKLIEELEQLEQQMQKTGKQAKGEESEGNIKQAMRQMKEEKVQDDMKEAEESLKSNHLNKAMDAQKKASKKLWDMVKTLEQKKQEQMSQEFQNMEMQMRQQIAEIDRLIELQTQLLDETLILPVGNETDPLNDRHLNSFFALSVSQDKLKIRCDEFTRKLEAIFENLVLFDIDPIAPLKQAYITMGEASIALAELRQPSSVDAEKEALKQLDKAREELAKAISKLMQEAEMQQMMQQMGILDEMIEKQLKINKETKEVDERIKPDQEIPDALQRLSKKLSRLQKELADTADSLKEQLRQMKEISELMKEVSKLLNEVKTGKKTQIIQEEIIEKLVTVLMQLQMQMSGSAQAMGMGVMGGRGGGGNRSGVQLPVQRGDRPDGISDDQWAKLSEKLKKELLDAWSEEYPSKFRPLLNIYYRRLAEEEIR